MSAEEDIQKTIAQFANSFDLKDWASMESAPAEVSAVDYSDLRGESARRSPDSNTSRPGERPSESQTPNTSSAIRKQLSTETGRR